MEKEQRTQQTPSPALSTKYPTDGADPGENQNCGWNSQRENLGQKAMRATSPLLWVGENEDRAGLRNTVFTCQENFTPWASLLMALAALEWLLLAH